MKKICIYVSDEMNDAIANASNGKPFTKQDLIRSAIYLGVNDIASISMTSPEGELSQRVKEAAETAEMASKNLIEFCDCPIIYKIIFDAGEKGVTEGSINSKYRTRGKRYVKLYLRQMVDAGFVKVSSSNHKAAGRPTVRYSLV
jgi:hypothetical protein